MTEIVVTKSGRMFFIIDRPDVGIRIRRSVCTVCRESVRPKKPNCEGCDQKSE